MEQKSFALNCHLPSSAQMTMEAQVARKLLLAMALAFL
jgi:hypothetical protein